MPLAREAAAAEIIGATALGLTASFLFLLFPDGRPPSRRWRPFPYVGAFAVAAVLLVMPVPIHSPPIPDPPRPVMICCRTVATELVSE